MTRAPALGPDPAVETIITRLDASPARAGSTRILAIDGPSGAGKTALSYRLASALGGAPIVHLDDFYPGWDGLAETTPRLVAWILQPLAEGKQARYRRYDWDRDEYAEWHDIPSSAVVLVEGAGAGARSCVPYLSLLVFVDAPEKIRFERAMARDGETYRPHWERWAAQERRHFALHKPRNVADLVLDTHDHGVA